MQIVVLEDAHGTFQAAVGDERSPVVLGSTEPSKSDLDFPVLDPVFLAVVAGSGFLHGKVLSLRTASMRYKAPTGKAELELELRDLATSQSHHELFFPFTCEVVGLQSETRFSSWVALKDDGEQVLQLSARQYLETGRSKFAATMTTSSSGRSRRIDSFCGLRFARSGTPLLDKI
jgi:hypothetical protein